MKSREINSVRCFSLTDDDGTNDALVTVIHQTKTCTCSEWLDWPMAGCQHTKHVHDLLMSEHHAYQRTLVEMAIRVLPEVPRAAA